MPPWGLSLLSFYCPALPVPLAHPSGEPCCSWPLLGLLPASGEGSEWLGQTLSPGP